MFEDGLFEDCLFEDGLFEASRAETAELGVVLGTMDRAATSRLLAAIGRQRASLDVLEADALVHLGALDDGGPNGSATVRAATRCSPRAADRAARRAEGLARMPRTKRALSEGRITAEHADALIATAETTSPQAVEQSELLEQAAERPADLAGREARRWAQRHSSHEQAREKLNRQRAARRLSVFSNEVGMTVLRGEFDPVTGAELSAAIEAEANRLFAGDGGRGAAKLVRTPEQRRADSLVALLTGSGGADSNQRQGRVKAPVRAQVLIVADAGVVDGSDPRGRCEIAGVGPIPPSELERLGCNSELFGLLFSGDGEPLWHGRGVRSATDAQFRSLVARDGGCVGCGKHPRYCEAHHLVPFGPPTFGPTDIDHLALVCGHDHHLIHDHGWVLVRHPDGSWSLNPPNAP